MLLFRSCQSSGDVRMGGVFVSTHNLNSIIERAESARVRLYKNVEVIIITCYHYFLEKCCKKWLKFRFSFSLRTRRCKTFTNRSSLASLFLSNFSFGELQSWILSSFLDHILSPNEKACLQLKYYIPSPPFLCCNGL